MTPFQALTALWSGTHALVLAPDTIVWVVEPTSRLYLVEQDEQVIESGRLSPAQAKRFVEACTGARLLNRYPLELAQLGPVAQA